MKMSKILKKIIGFFDRILILPIAKFFTFVSKKLKFNGRAFEKMLTVKPGLIIVSLIVAGIFFFVATTRSTSLIETSAEVLYDQPISATYNEEAYVIEGLPETVDITLIGRKADIYLAKQLPTNDITIDLTGLEPGVHRVNLKYKKALSSVEYKLDPSVATIVIYKKDIVEKEVNYEVINKDKIDSKYIVENITLSNDSVYVKGNDATLSNVASVKALIDLKNLTTVDIGEQKLEKVKLVAYNSDGEKVKAEIVPSEITAMVNISSPHKEVPIKVIPTKYDKIVFGKAISNITTDINKVTIYGEPSKLENINYVPVEVDVSNLKETKRFSVSLKKPTGVKEISAKNVNVTIELGNESSKQIEDVYINYENLAEGLKVNAVGKENTKVTVNIKGVDSIISELDPSTIKAYVDLKGLGVGTHEIPVNVTGSDLRVKYFSETTKITLKIIEN